MSLSKLYEPIPFRLWCAENKEDLDRQFQSMNFVGDSDCKTCDGFGMRDCDLGHDHDCDECDGSGKIEQTYEEALHDYALDEYRVRVTEDKERVKVYEEATSCP